MTRKMPAEEYGKNERETKKEIARIAKERINKANAQLASLIALNRSLGEGSMIIAELAPLENIFERLDAIYLSMNKILMKN